MASKAPTYSSSTRVSRAQGKCVDATALLLSVCLDAAPALLSAALIIRMARSTRVSRSASVCGRTYAFLLTASHPACRVNLLELVTMCAPLCVRIVRALIRKWVGSGTQHAHRVYIVATPSPSWHDLA